MSWSAVRTRAWRVSLLLVLLCLAVVPGVAPVSANEAAPAGSVTYLDKDPEIALDSTGAAHVTWWRDSSDGSLDGIWYATNAGGSWATERVTSGTHDSYPVIDLDGDDDVVISYIRPYLDSATPGIFVSTNASGSWATRLFVRDTNVDAQHDMVVAPNGAIHVAWHGARTPGRNFHYATDATGTVVATEIAPGETASAVSIDRAPNGTIHIAYQRSDRGDANLSGIYHVKIPTSAPRTSAHVVRTPYAQWPVITVDAAGTPRLLYFSLRLESHGLRVLAPPTYPQSLEYSEGQLAIGMSSAVGQFGGVIADGRVHAAWVKDSGYDEIHVSEANADDTSDRTSNLAASATEADLRQPAIAVDAAGTDHVVYVHASGDVYYVAPTVEAPAPAAWSEPIAISTYVTPEVNEPQRAPRLGQIVGTNSSVPEAVTWSLDPAASGVTGYELRRSTNGGAWTNVPITPGPETVNLSLTPGTYRFQVRTLHGTDPAGPWMTAPPAVLTILQEAKAKVTKTWTNATVSGSLGGKVRRSTERNASATFTFVGRSAALVAPTGNAYGRVKVFVDGVLQTTVDLRQAAAKRRVVWVHSWPTSDPHVVKLVVEGTSGRPKVEIDAFVFDR